MGKTSIQWCDHSINPFKARNIETGAVGHFCAKCSPGCKNCYSSKMQKPFLTKLEFLAENRPKVELFFDEKAIEQVLKRKKPTRYFWSDMTDMFWEEYSDEWIDRCFAVMACTPQHTHLVLTKRAARMRRYMQTHHAHGLSKFDDVRKWMVLISSRMKPETSWPLSNVWLGVSVEDQLRKERIDELRQIPAAVRFVSFEPLLEDLGDIDLIGIHWAIWGGESGPNACPCDIEWIGRGMKQAKAQGVKNFVKQLGARPMLPAGNDGGDWPEGTRFGNRTGDQKWNGRQVILRDKKGGNMEEWPSDLRVREFPEVRR